MSLSYVDHVDVDGAVVLSPVGDFDIATLDVLRSALLDALGVSEHLVIDLSRTTFMDSMALGVVLGVVRRLNEDGTGWVRLANPQPQIRTVLRITGVAQVLGVYLTVAEALVGGPSEGAGQSRATHGDRG